jgi:ribosomal protein L30E
VILLAEKDVKKHIRTLFEEGRTIIGSDRVLKALRLGGIKKAYTASNIPALKMKEAQTAAKATGIELEQLELSAGEIGVLCKKPFNILLLGIK